MQKKFFFSKENADDSIISLYLWMIWPLGDALRTLKLCDFLFALTVLLSVSEFFFAESIQTRRGWMLTL